MGITALNKARAIKKQFIRKYLKDISAACGLSKLGDSYRLEVRLQNELPGGVKLPKTYMGMGVVVRFTGKIRSSES